MRRRRNIRVLGFRPGITDLVVSEVSVSQKVAQPVGGLCHPEERSARQLTSLDIGSVIVDGACNPEERSARRLASFDVGEIVGGVLAYVSPVRHS